MVDGEVVDTTPNGVEEYNEMVGLYEIQLPFVLIGLFSKKAFWQLTSGEEITKYKGTRDRMPNAMFDAIGLTETPLLRQAGVSCFAKEGYEADDLVAAVIEKSKVLYPDVPIDVVTGDSDLLPLVDEQVSVFFRSRKRQLGQRVRQFKRISTFK